MKYYKIETKRFYENDMIATNAQGKKIENADDYFWKMNRGEMIDDAPLIFDYFYLQSFDVEKYWEWLLTDVHGFMGIGSIIGGWYISDDFKLLLENFKIAPKYHFYETRLSYRGDKLKYWIFQFPIEPFKNIDFQKSNFILEKDKKIYNFLSEEEYLKFYRFEYKTTKRKLKILCQVLKSSYDLFLTTQNEKIISEKLREAIEKMGLEGFEFSELDYEVVVEK